MKKIITLLFTILSFRAMSQTTYQNLFTSPQYQTLTPSAVSRSDGSMILLASAIPTGTGTYWSVVYITDSTGNITYKKRFEDVNPVNGSTPIRNAAFYAHGNNAIYKFDTLGQIVWDKVFVDTAQVMTINSIVQTNDNGLFMIGSAHPVTGGRTALLLMKTDSSGAVLWQHEYDYYHSLAIGKLFPDVYGGFKISGSFTDSTENLFIIDVDSSGNLTNVERHSKYMANNYKVINFDSTSGNIYFTAIDSTINIIGSMRSGQVHWTRELKGNSMVIDNDTIYLFTKSQNNFADQIEWLDTSGNFIGDIAWQQNESANSNLPVTFFKDNFRFKCIGLLDDGISIVQFDHSSPTCFINQPGSSAHNFNFTNDTMNLVYDQTSFHDSLVSRFQANIQTTLTKLCLSNNIDQLTTEQFTIFPNPANDMLNIRSELKADYTINIVDAFGKIVRTLQQHESEFTSINIQDLPAGCYFITIHSLQSNYEKQFFVIK